MKITYSILVLTATILASALASGESLAAESDGACVHKAAPAGTKGKRVAVIVGNGAYTNGIPVLPNPTNDADATTKAIAALGFETYLSTNADGAALQKCLDTAYGGLDNADVAMLYYSGHGIQIKDENYIVATDAGTKDLKHGFVAVQPIVDALQKHAKATLVLLDACRNNPMTEGGQPGLSVSTGRGLSRAKEEVAPTGPAAVQSRGLLVAYSTSPNAVALDGTGHLSPFTAAFVKIVGTSGYSIQRVMGDVTKAVGDETDYAQTPWMKSSLSEELKLGGGDTLDEARSLSDNHAARAKELLRNQGKTQEAIVEALKGLPASPDEAALQRFPKAYLALYSAMQSHEIILPLEGGGHSQVAVSTQDRVAVFTQTSGGTMGGTLELWSASDRKVVAKPDAGKGMWKFQFSSHGKYLATQSLNSVSVFNGLDGTKLFEMRAGSSLNSMEFSPDETHLMLAGSGLVMVDIATGKPTMVVKAGQLLEGTKKKRYTLAQATFGGNDAVCYIVNGGGFGSDGLFGVFDLKAGKPSHLQETASSVAVILCDPAGKYMVRSFAVNSSDQGMEIWDLAHDKLSAVKGPIVNLLGIDPKGDYVSAAAFSDEAEGLYDLASAKKGHPQTVPDGFSILGSRVYDAAGKMVNEDLNPNPWRDWPDESLYGPALVQKAMAGLTPEQRDAIDKGRINFAVVAGTR